MTTPITHEAARELVDVADGGCLGTDDCHALLAYIAQAELVEQRRDKWKKDALRSSGELAADDQQLLRLEELSDDGAVMLDAWGPMDHDGRMSAFDRIASRIGEIKRERDELKARTEKVLHALQSLGDAVNLDRLIEREDDARLAAVVRSHGRHILEQLEAREDLSVCDGCAAVAKAIAEALK